MSWTTDIVEELGRAGAWHYGHTATSVAASEPTALAAMVLAAYDRPEHAERARAWLAARQSPDGSLGVTELQAAPHWPTGLAVLAWRMASTYPDAIDRAITWMLGVYGTAQPRNNELGHNTTLRGWPWVETTHSWVEPTAFNVLALKAAGRTDHPRVREAVALLIDRQLPDGGCNYGNSIVLEQVLRPHLQPTGLMLAALHGETDDSGRLERSLQFAAASLEQQATAASLACALIGLAAHDRFPVGAERLLATAARATRQYPNAQPRLSLLALAALGRECPLLPTWTKERTA